MITNKIMIHMVVKTELATTKLIKMIIFIAYFDSINSFL